MLHRLSLIYKKSISYKNNEHRLIIFKEIVKYNLSIEEKKKLILKITSELYCDENIRFLITYFKIEKLKNHIEICQESYKLISNFIESGSRYEINLKYNTRKKLTELKKSRKIIRINSFDEVLNEILNDILQNEKIKKLFNL